MRIGCLFQMIMTSGPSLFCVQHLFVIGFLQFLLRFVNGNNLIVCLADLFCFDCQIRVKRIRRICESACLIPTDSSSQLRSSFYHGYVVSVQA
jgi:hypothetical protein